MSIKSFPQLPVLIIDDEEDVLQSYKISLCYNGINNLMLCNDSRNAMPILKEKDVSIIILDLFMPYITGHELLDMIYQEHPDIPVIVITGSNKVETAVECMKCGAFDYMVKPVERSRLYTGVKRAIEIRELKEQLNVLSEQMLSKDLKHPEAFKGMITNNESMKSIFKYIEAIAPSPKSVLITGESGSGKELIARAIHNLSRRTGSFIAVNVGGLDDNLFSDTLFGHMNGAFTDAKGKREGLIVKAESGTLFLDEIGDLDNNSQVKLLRLLQEREYYPLGSDIPRICDVKIVAATNTDLKLKQTQGLFRNDLYYRLLTHHITIPPLRERLDDLPFLIDHFLEQAADSLGKKTPAIPKELSILLRTYDFPGNIRELQSMIFDAVSRHESKMLSLSVFKEYLTKHSSNNYPDQEELSEKNMISFSGRFPTIKEVENYFIDAAMKKAKGNQSIAAQILGISQSTLSRRFKDSKD